MRRAVLSCAAFNYGTLTRNELTRMILTFGGASWGTIMKFMLNGLGELAVTYAFENGWTISIARLPCQHIAITIVPSYIAENEKAGTEIIMASGEKYSIPAMIERGDFIPHFDGDDTELLDIITQVQLRWTEAHFAKIGQDIMKAVKS